MQNSSFDFLLDGQIESKVSFWQQRLQEEPSAALSVCQSLCHSLMLPEQDAAKWREEKNGCIVLFQQLLKNLDFAIERMPRQKGFFSSADERHRVYVAAYRLLNTVRQAKEELQARIPCFSGWEDALRKRMQDASLIEENLRTAKQVAHWRHEEQTAASFDDLLGLLLSENEKALIMARQIEFLRHTLDTLCHQHLSAFADRLSQTADFGHEGENCRISDVLRLCEECKSSVRACMAESGGCAEVDSSVGKSTLKTEE